MTAVLDSSAVLALLWSEPGSGHVEAVLAQSIISAVNLAEVCSKLADRGIAGPEVRKLLLDLPIKIIAFDELQALHAGELRQSTRHLGLSIGDRACLGLAIAHQAPAITADRTWAELELNVPIKVIR